MGLRRSAGISLLVFAVALTTVSAVPHEPTVYSVSWDGVPEQFFPHPDLCIGTAQVDRQRALGAAYYFDSDGCKKEARAALGFVDRDGSGGASQGDRFYVQPLASVKVQSGDLRLGSDAPVVVAAADLDTGLSSSQVLDPRWDFLDGDGDRRWSVGDVAYLDLDESGYFSPGDLVLDADLRAAALGTPGMFYALHAAEGGLCFVDDNGSGAWEPKEPAYLVLGRACAFVEVGDLRIAATRGLRAGTTVIEAAVDYRNPLTPFASPQGMIGTAGPHQVLDLDGSGTLTGGDLVIEDGLQAPGSPDGARLEAKGVWAYVDLDGDGTATGRDLLYVDRDENGRTSAGDVRFSSFLDRPFGSVVQAGDPDDLSPLPARQKEGTGGMVDGSAARAGDAKGSPAPGLAPFLLFFTLGFLAARRRRRGDP